MTLSTIHEDEGTNPVVRTTPLRAFPGWIVREYADGMYDATQPAGVGLTPGFESFEEVVAFLGRKCPKCGMLAHDPDAFCNADPGHSKRVGGVV